jgi:putative addiction module component (TIGR02574 family)
VPYTGFVTRTDLEREALRLPVDDRLELIEVIWESLERDAAQVPITDWQRQILDERIAEDDSAPEDGSPWHEVKKRALESL